MTVRRLLTALLGVGVIGFLVLAVATQWRELEDVEVAFAPGWYGAALAALVAYQAVQGEIAVQVTRGLGQRLPARRIRSIFAASVVARYVPSGVLAVAARITLGERAGIPRRVAVAGLVYELAIAMGAAGIVALALLDRISPWLAAGAAAVATGVLALLLSPVVFRRLADAVLVRMGHDPLPAAVSERRALALVAAAAASFLLAGIAVMCVVRSLVPLPGGAVPVIIASAAGGFVTSMVGFALPGGIGAREAGITGVLVLVLPGPLAVAVAVVCRLVQTAAELLYSGAVTAWDRAPGARAALRR